MFRIRIGPAALIVLPVVLVLVACGAGKPAPTTLTPPILDTQLRYAEVVHQWAIKGTVSTGQPAEAVIEQRIETWVAGEVLDVERKSEQAQDPRTVSGDPAVLRGQSDYKAYSRPFHWVGPALRVGDLPKEAAALDSALTKMVVSKEPDPAFARYAVVRIALDLLTYPNAIVAHRGALVGLTEQSAGMTAIPDFQDPMKRSGVAMRLPIGAAEPKQEFTVLFDGDKKELLFWSFGPVGGRLDERHLVVCSGIVRQVDQRTNCADPDSRPDAPAVLT